MLVCSNCGEQNPERARFCSNCAQPLGEDAPSSPYVRKTVTILFCDVTGSTSLGEQLDPESLRSVMLRYFDEMRSVLEHHGGTVEKFIGDAVMAVFGVPTLHEDDALRAVRAAEEMRAALARLNEDFERVWGVHLQARIGINTGEVVTGEIGVMQTLASGDAVNVAARLQQAAKPGEILIGTETHRLVEGAVQAGPLEAYSLKGKSQTVAPFRLDRVIKGARGLLSQLDSPLVGRERERQVLGEAFARAVSDRSCELVTVVGPAGVGKSRLVHDFVVRLLDAAAMQGRCLPYGEGITYWPVVEVVKQAAGTTEDDSPDEARAKIAALLHDDEGSRIADGVAAAVGLTEQPPRSEEVFWALRRFWEGLAQDHPVVLVLEDVHWAEPTLLDLLEYVSGWSKGAPILILCLARPELLDARPTWPVTIHLEPLEAEETSELIANLLGSQEVEESVARCITDAADGNPLFVEELLRMMIDDGLLRQVDEGWRAARTITHLDIPVTIHALLAARLDKLEVGERDVLQRASISGKVFWWGAVAELSPADLRPDVARHLHSLLRKRVIFPEEATGFAGEDGFRFGHLLVRDAAYRSIPKGLRAELHELYGDWLLRKAGERDLECEEIVGYHLEQAYLARGELGPLDDRGHELAARAGGLLGSAGRRAFARDDMPAALKLLDRAVSLVTADDPTRLELMRGLSSASWSMGELSRAEALLNEIVEQAVAVGDRRLEWYALLERAARRTQSDLAEGTDELIRVAEQAIAVFEELGDDVGLARAWRRVSWARRLLHQFGPAAEAGELAVLHARKAGDPAEESRIVDGLCTCLLYGPAAVADAVRRCETMLAEVGENRLMAANVLTPLAGLEAMRGRFEAARSHVSEARAIYDDLGLQLALAGLTQIAGPLELLAGEPRRAEVELRRGLAILENAGGRGMLALQSALLAEALYAQDRLDEARELATTSRDSAAPDFVGVQVRWRVVSAKLATAARENGAHALELAREAVCLADRTDAPNLHADALIALADALRAGGSEEEATVALREALRLYEGKGNLVSAARTRTRLTDLGASATVQPGAGALSSAGPPDTGG